MILTTPEPTSRTDGATMTSVGADIIDQFESYQQFCGFSPKTLRRRRWTLTHLAVAIEPRPLLGATRDDIFAFIAARAAASTRHSLRSDIHQFFVWAINQDLATVDPTMKLGRIRVPKHDPNPLTRDQIHLAIANARPRTRLMIMLGAYAGLRVSEIAAIRVDDFAHTGRISVRQGKGSKDRGVPLAPELAAELERWKARGRIGADGRLFAGATPDSVSSCIRTVFRSVGIDNRPHDLRAAFATSAAERCNGNVIQVAKLLGHVSVVTTQRYVGWNPDGAGIVDDLYGEPDDAA